MALEEVIEYKRQKKELISSLSIQKNENKKLQAKIEELRRELRHTHSGDLKDRGGYQEKGVVEVSIEGSLFDIFSEDIYKNSNISKLYMNLTEKEAFQK